MKQKLEKLEKMKKKGTISKEIRAEIRDIRALLDESYKTAKTVKANKKRISNKDLATMTPQKRWYHKHKSDLAKTRKNSGKKKTTKIHKVTAKVASGKRISNSELKGATAKTSKTKTKAKTARLSNKQLKNMSKLDNVLS